MTTSSSKNFIQDDAAEIVRVHTSRAGYLLKRSEQTLTALFLEKCRDAGIQLTYSQLLLLSAISTVPDAHQAIAARLTGMDAPTTTIVAKSLVKHGLAQQKSNAEDRRQRILVITEAGREASQLALACLAAAQESLLAATNKKDRQHLLELLVIIAGNSKSNAPPLCNRHGQSITTPDYLPREVLPAFLINRCLQVSVSLITPALVPFGLSIGQYVSLVVLTTMEECNLATLQKTMGRKRSSLSLILSSLEERSLVNIRQQGRSLVISPTQKGINLFFKARPNAETANEQILADLSSSQVKDFARILRAALGHHGKLMFPSTA